MGAESSSAGDRHERHASRRSMKKVRSAAHLRSLAPKSETWTRFNDQELTLLDRMFQDLASRSPDTTMSKDTFLEYFCLPGILGERLFDVFDAKNNGVIGFDEFVNGLARYNKGTTEEKMDMLFDMYDLDGMSKITKEELTVVLLSIITPTTSLFFDDTSSGLIQDDEQLTHVSKVTRTLVSTMVEEAFKFASIADKTHLSREEFHEWLVSSPTTIEMLETVLAKHMWAGFESTKDMSSSTLEPPSPATPRSSRRSPVRTGSMSPRSSRRSPPTASPKPSRHSSKKSSPIVATTELSLAPPSPMGSLRMSLGIVSPRTSLPSSMLPMYSKMSELYVEATAVESYVSYVCGDCDFEFYTTMHVESTTGDDLARFLVLKRTGKRDVSMNFCPECGCKLTAHTRTSELRRDEEKMEDMDAARVLFSAAAASASAEEAASAAAFALRGMLYKKQKKLKGKTMRYYVLKDKFLYGYRKVDDTVPSEALFIQGWFIRALADTREEAKNFFGIELMPPAAIKHGTYLRFAKSKEDRVKWIEALQNAASTVSFYDHFKIGGELGRGHFSVVHKATHKKSGKEYAIKIIEKSKVDMREKQALRNEMAILKLVKHPGIVNMVNVYEDRRMIYMVMPLIPYGDLFARWKSKTTKVFPEETAKVMIYKLLDSVQYLHSLGIVHRDLKPENILCLDPLDDTKFVISDFGLSKFAAPHAEMTMPCGTLAYVAPEVISQQKYDWKVDIWSLGCIMHLLLRGVLPFDGRTKEEVIERTLRKALSFTHPKWASVSSIAKDLLAAMLQKNPKDRITIVDAMNHEWFAGVREMPEFAHSADMEAAVLSKMLDITSASSERLSFATMHRATSLVSAMSPAMDRNGHFTKSRSVGGGPEFFDVGKLSGTPVGDAVEKALSASYGSLPHTSRGAAADE